MRSRERTNQTPIQMVAPLDFRDPRIGRMKALTALRCLLHFDFLRCTLESLDCRLDLPLLDRNTRREYPLVRRRLVWLRSKQQLAETVDSIYREFLRAVEEHEHIASPNKSLFRKACYCIRRRRSQKMLDLI